MLKTKGDAVMLAFVTSGIPAALAAASKFMEYTSGDPLVPI